MTEKIRRLYRSESDRKLGGVAGGLGDYLGIDPTLIRLPFVLGVIFAGTGGLLYLILWLVVPEESEVVAVKKPVKKTPVKAKSNPVKKKAS